MAMTPETGVVESKIYEQRVTVVDVASGSVRQLSRALSVRVQKNPRAVIGECEVFQMG